MRPYLAGRCLTMVCICSHLGQAEWVREGGSEGMSKGRCTTLLFLLE